MLFLASTVESTAFCSDQLGTRRDLYLTLKTGPEMYTALVYRVCDAGSRTRRTTYALVRKP